jgi:hypothetical protein
MSQIVSRNSFLKVLALCSVLLLAAMPAQGLDRPLWDKLTTKVGPDAQVPGWYINLGITGARAMITKEEPTKLLVIYVFKSSPAFGKLEKGDKIVGANGNAFVTPHKFGYGVGKFGYEGPMMDLGNALEDSQGKLDGKLVLEIERDGRKFKTDMRLTTKYGSYAQNYPFDCKKTDIILKETCAYLIERQKADGLWSDRPNINAFAALALLGSGDKMSLPAVKKAMQAMARKCDGEIEYEGLPVWHYTLYGIALSEYYLKTHEPWVLPALEKINHWLVLAQHPPTAAPERKHVAGGFGHGPHNPAGANGYGAFNAVTAQAMMAWALIDRCGLGIDERRFQAAHEFIALGTNKIGYVWYADASGGPGYADMGRTGASALAHSLAHSLDPAQSDKLRAFGLLNAGCIGKHPDTFIDTHGSPLLGMVWTALGAATDPPSFRKLMDANRWAFSLSQCADGTFYYQPNRDNNPQDYASAPRLSATAATALILTLSRKQLQITGAAPIARAATHKVP